MGYLELKSVKKSFGKQAAVKSFDLDIQEGEFISFLGGSGCGKTTTLRMIAGFETPDAGQIQLQGQDLTSLAPQRRGIGMVFQNYALFPNMNVQDNIGFGLKIAGMKKAAIYTRVQELLKLIRMPDLDKRFPTELSGGQQQRVALARALATNPKVLLLDEPLSALDAKMRLKLRHEIREIQKKLKITTIYVTHDQEEALSLSDRIVVMNEGCIEQVGTPAQIYNTPKTNFTASFIGTFNQLEAIALEDGKLSIQGQEIFCPQINLTSKVEKYKFVLRPERIKLQAPSEGEKSNTLMGKVESLSFLGPVVRIKLDLGNQDLQIDCFNDPAFAWPRAGDSLRVWFPPEALLPLENR